MAHRQQLHQSREQAFPLGGAHLIDLTAKQVTTIFQAYVLGQKFRRNTPKPWFYTALYGTVAPF